MAVSHDRIGQSHFVPGLMRKEITMKKRIIVAIAAILLAVLSVTVAYAASPCPYCGGKLTSIGCSYTSLDNCELEEQPCNAHSNCNLQYYYADTTQRCNSCNMLTFNTNVHLHAVGHRENGWYYPFSMELVCAWW